MTGKNLNQIISYIISTEEIRHAFTSKHNSKCENKIILLMITVGKKWHDLAVKNCLHCFAE